MKFRLSFLALLISLVCLASSAPVRRQSNPVWDATSISREFQISLQNRSFPWPTDRLPLLSVAPSIGHYQNAGTGRSGATDGEFYNFRKRLALIELATSAYTALPSVVAQSINSKRFRQPIQINIMISGGVQLPSEDSRNKTYNLIFHSWLSALYGNQQVNTNPLLGIFMPNGAYGVSIAVNSLQPCNVNVHGSDLSTYALSPDNARIGIEKNREISTFWSVGYAPGKDAGVVTFHILANSLRTEQAVERACQTASTMNELIQGLRKFAGTLKNAADQQALKDAIATIEGLVKA